MDCPDEPLIVRYRIYRLLRGLFYRNYVQQSQG